MLGSPIVRVWPDDCRRRARLLGVWGEKDGGGEASEGDRGELGVGLACLSALMTVLVMFVFPLWAVAVLTIDFLVSSRS